MMMINDDNLVPRVIGHYYGTRRLFIETVSISYMLDIWFSSDYAASALFLVGMTHTRYILHMHFEIIIPTLRIMHEMVCC
jgi:hypothetical protein